MNQNNIIETYTDELIDSGKWDNDLDSLINELEQYLNRIPESMRIAQASKDSAESKGNIDPDIRIERLEKENQKIPIIIKKLQERKNKPAENLTSKTNPNTSSDKVPELRPAIEKNQLLTMNLNKIQIKTKKKI